MKKILNLMFLVLGLTLGTAQQVTPAKERNIATAKPLKVQTEKKATSTVKNPAIKLKKDGTPDKRYKANQRLKKDGTPDKRFKIK